MKPVRTILSLASGLLLLFQSFAVTATAPARSADADRSPAAAMVDLPCHGVPDDASDGLKASCCDDDCPDMVNCVLGHLAAAPALAIATEIAATTVAAAPTAAPRRPDTASPLRPPISPRA